jgi:hypothetical protein
MKVSITAKPTSSQGQPTLSVDPEVSLRAELTGAIGAAQIDIANAIAELSRSGADSAALANQGQALQQLQKQVGSANLGSLLALRGDVTATAASATALANQAISTATSAAANANLSPAQRARASLETLQRDLFENKVLDPYLKFSSAKDEEEYRKREAERDAEIKRALALGTPGGLRRATNLMQEQLRDAGAHGADRSPDFERLVNTASEARELAMPHEKQRSAVDDVQPTVSNDVADIAATLRAAGLSGPPPTNNQSGHGLSFDKLAAVGRANDGRG